MTWNYVASGDHDTIKTCIKLCVDTAAEHGTNFGTTPVSQEAAAAKLKTKMASGGLRIKHQPHHTEDNKKGAVTLLFHRMNWLTNNHDKRITAPVWVLTIAFDQKSVFPYASNDAKTKDQDYEDFLDTLNADTGPVRSFLRDNSPLASLYLIDPAGGSATDDKKHIGRLERVGQSWQKKPAKKCVFRTPVTIDSKYVGTGPHGAITIPTSVLGFWGKHTSNRFDLTEVKFTL